MFTLHKDILQDFLGLGGFVLKDKDLWRWIADRKVACALQSLAWKEIELSRECGGSIVKRGRIAGRIFYAFLFLAIFLLVMTTYIVWFS